MVQHLCVIRFSTQFISQDDTQLFMPDKVVASILH